MALEIVTSETTNAAVLKAELQKIKERDGELNFRAQKTLEYLEQFCRISEKKAAELMEKLLALNVPRLRDMHYNKIIDIMPTHMNDVKVALQGYNITVTNDNCKKIADTVAEFVE